MRRTSRSRTSLSTRKRVDFFFSFFVFHQSSRIPFYSDWSPWPIATISPTLRAPPALPVYPVQSPHITTVLAVSKRFHHQVPPSVHFGPDSQQPIINDAKWLLRGGRTVALQLPYSYSSLSPATKVHKFRPITIWRSTVLFSLFQWRYICHRHHIVCHQREL